MARHRNFAIIIPAFNEAANIGDIVTAAGKFASVLVIDDGSSDSTGKIARSAGAKVIQHQSNLGYDRALTSGLTAVFNRGFRFAITLDADGEHHPVNLAAFIEAFNNSDQQLLLGIRPQIPRIAERLFCKYFYQRYGGNDIICGMKGYRRNLWLQLAPEIGFQLQGFGTNLAIAALRSGCKFTQIRISGTQRRDVPRLGRAVTANFAIAKAAWQMILWDRMAARRAKHPAQPSRQKSGQ